MKEPQTQVTESHLIKEIMEAIENIDRQGLTDFANTLLGTDFSLEDIEWAE